MLRLKMVAADLQDGSGDDRIDQVLAEIDLRVAVELAKAGLSKAKKIQQFLRFMADGRRRALVLHRPSRPKTLARYRLPKFVVSVTELGI